MNTVDQNFPFFQGNGEIRQLLRSHDWTASPLGPPHAWPQELHTVMDLALNAKYPTVVVWGSEAIFLYNDAYTYILGDRHPFALGRRFQDVWPEIWPDIGPIVKDALAGIPAYFEDVPVMIAPNGVPEQRWFTSSYSPVKDRHGKVLGMFNAGFETTSRIVSEKRRAFQLALADRLHALSSPEEMIATASEMVGRELNVSRAMYAEVDDAHGTFFIRRDWTQPGMGSLAGQVRQLDDFGPDAISLLRSGQALAVHDVACDARTAAYLDRYVSIDVRASVAVPLLSSGRLVALLLLHSSEPRNWQDAELKLVEDVAERTWLAGQASRVEEDLRETRCRLTAVFDVLPVGIAVVDANGEFVLSNREMEGYMPTNVLPSRDNERHGRWRAYGPEGHAVGRHDFAGARALRGERVVPGIEALYTQDDGTEIWTQVSAVPIKDGAGRITGQVSVVTDIDALKRTETALRLSEERYRALFTQMDAGFCIVRLIFNDRQQPVDFLYIETNPMFERQAGISSALGKTIHELVPDIEPLWLETFGHIGVTGEARHFERYSDSLKRWFDVNAFRIGDPEDYQVAVLFRDITDRKKTEGDLQRLAEDLAESNRLKSQFLAVLAHELRNPLAPILTGLELMRMRPDSPETVARVREMLERQANQMVHLVNDLLDLARVTSGKIKLRKEHVDLNSIVSNAVESSLPAIEAAQHELNLQLYEKPLTLNADATRMTQVISNLLTNAAKYTPQGGRIRLTIEKDGDEAIISISDNGIGIPAESLYSVFEMFNQVGRNTEHSQGGLGIGLGLVRELVELHGGTATAASEGQGKGSTFIVRLPVEINEKQTVDDDLSSARRNAAKKRLRILVADDNADAAQSLATFLKVCGHDIQIASDGPQAVKIAASFRPDIAFLDIGMPNMTGYEVARRLRAIEGLKHMRIVAVTGWGAEEDRARSKEAGFDRHFIKPISPVAVTHLLDEMV